MTNIIESLNLVLAETDNVILEKTKTWAIERKNAILEFRKTEEYKEIQRDAWKLYEKLYALAGGKCWYRVLSSNNEAGILKFVEKNHVATIEKRNAKIKKQLEKAGVTEVIESNWTETTDGFNGIFSVKTDMGKKTVTITTIYAGGYNIQCAHNRVLVKIK